MNSPRKLLAMVASVAVLTACTSAATSDTTADQAAIRGAAHVWYEAFNNGDAAAVAALYADDAVLAAPNVPAVKGNAAIRDLIATDIDTFRSSGLTVTQGATSDVGVSGDVAWLSDTWTVTDKNGATVDVGKALTIFQRRGGKWLMIRDTWNSDGPILIHTTRGSSTFGAPTR
jgi:ketosteroid isomerase-like protein